MRKLVEKGKSAFVGPEIAGKELGVIGLGAIGVLVANAAQAALGMKVYGYDPYISVDAAWKLSRGDSPRHNAGRNLRGVRLHHRARAADAGHQRA